jgi:hypothetical protein
MVRHRWPTLQALTAEREARSRLNGGTNVLPYGSDDPQQERRTYAQSEALIERVRRASRADASLARLIVSIADEGEKQPDATTVRPSSQLKEGSL